MGISHGFGWGGWAWGSICVGLVVCLGAASRPNAVVDGSRPIPYGYFIPDEHYATLLKRHAVRVRVKESMTWREIAEHYYRWHPLPDRALRLRDLNLLGGTELPEDLDTKLPEEVQIWLSPQAQDDASCAIWIRSSQDGWILPQVPISEIGFLKPTQSHAAGGSGSTDVQLMPVPLRLQGEWIELLRAIRVIRARHADPSETIARADPALRALYQRVYPGVGDASFRFSFSQWVHERSRVARAMVSLPIADVDGVVKFAETPVVHWLDAHGKETPPYVPAPASPLFLVLVSVAGGAVLGYLLFAARARRSRNPS